LPEVSRKDLEVGKLLRSCYTYPCSTWEYFGDWNKNGVFSSMDLVLYNQFMLSKNLDPTSDVYDLWANFGENHPEGAWDWSQLNTLNCTSDGGGYYLGYVDRQACYQYLLGIVGCN
jgi:hypothetical protein